MKSKHIFISVFIFALGLTMSSCTTEEDSLNIHMPITGMIGTDNKYVNYTLNSSKFHVGDKLVISLTGGSDSIATDLILHWHDSTTTEEIDTIATVYQYPKEISKVMDKRGSHFLFIHTSTLSKTSSDIYWPSGYCDVISIKVE